MYSSEKAIGILLSIILIFTNTSAYSHPENLASNSLFKLWEKKKINPQEGLIIEARLRAIHSGISQGRCTSEDLSAIDEEVTQRHTSTEFLTKYPFNYNLKFFKDKRIWGMMSTKIYRDKYGYRQLVLFYNPNNPPWDILIKFGVRTNKEREFAKRGFWITYKDTPPDPGRRTFLLTLVALGFASCVFDPSGLPEALDGGITSDAGPTLDGGPTTDGGTQPINAVEQEIQITVDNSNNPVTILPTSEFSSDDTSQRLSPLSQFVRNNNAAFRYNGRNWHWVLSETDRSNIINNGLTYVFNGRNHKIKLIGEDNTGQTKIIIFNLQIPRTPNYGQAYRVTISSSQIAQLAQQIGLDLRTIDIHFENLEPEEDFVLNGVQRQYAVVPTQEEVTPDRINPDYERIMSRGVAVDATPTAQGVDMRVTIRAGDNGQYGGINIPTRSGGIDLNEPNLQAAWKMDGVDLGIDSGANGNTLTNVNGVGSVPGKSGNAAEFRAGDHTYLTIPPEEQTNLHLTGDMTVSAWVKTNGYPHNGFAIAEKIGVGATNIVDYTFYLRDGEMRSWNGIDNIRGNLLVPDNEWHHIAFVRHGGNVTFYLDGQPNGTFPQEFPNTSEDTPLFIGHNGQIDEDASAYGNGLLDELAIFDRALTPEEIQGIYNQVDSGNFSTPTLSTLEFRGRGNSPFKLRLIDDEDRELDVFITGLDPDTMRNVTINLAQARTIMNPAFNLDNVRLVEILIEDTFLPVPDGEELEVFIETQGLIGTPDGTRGEYAYDPDLTEEESEILRSKLSEATPVDLPSIEGHPIVGIRSWDGILTPDGLNFKPKDNKFSAFHIGNTIYIPSPYMIMDKIHIGGEAKDNLRKALDRRNHTILYHELHEIKGWNHKQAVLSEFEDSINGLNYADIVTILLGVLIKNNINKIDNTFHELFIRELLLQRMPLSINTYSRIVEEILNTSITPEEYNAIIQKFKELVSTYLEEKAIYTEGIDVDIDKEGIQSEPGYADFTKAIQGKPQKGTIPVDLSRFFIRNDTLSNAITIDTEYFRKFIYFARRLGPDIKLIGITSMPEEDTAIKQILALIQQHLPEFRTYYNIDFANYQTTLQNLGIDTRHAVSILSEESAGRIHNSGSLKIIAPFLQDYNRATTTWQEFRATLEGINKEKSEFMHLIIQIAGELLRDLVQKKQLTEQNATQLLEEIRNKGIGFIPVYYDPVQYYRSIEHMKTLLTAA